MGPPIDPFESNDTAMTPVSTKSYCRQASNLTLPLAGMEALSRTTTMAETPGSGTNTPGSTHPFSAFYSHPKCAVSSEQSRTSYNKERSTTSFDKDLERGLCRPPATLLTPQASARPSLEPSITTTQTNNSFNTPVKTVTTCGDKSYITVWPAGSELRQRKEDARRMKGCFLFRNLSRKQKIIAKIVIAVLIVGVATAIGCAISYKTGGLVWKSSNNYGAIGR